MTKTKNKSFTFKPIGYIRTKNTELTGAPIQAAYDMDSTGTIELLPEYAEGLKDLDGFSHIQLIFVFDRHSEFKLEVIPYLDNKPRGVFATRAPRRPNQIGISIVKLKKISGTRIEFLGADMLDMTPLLDIKPLVPAFDLDENTKIGWLEGKINLSEKKTADGRFL